MKEAKMYKAIFLLLIDLILIAASISYINSYNYLDITSIALFLFTIFILFPLLIFAIYLIIQHIKEYIKNHNNPAISKYLYNSLKIIYGLLLITFGIFFIFDIIENGLNSQIATLISILIIIYTIKRGVSIIIKSLLSLSKT